MRHLIVCMLLLVPTSASAAIGDVLADRQREDFFTFFNWQEASPSPTPAGTVRHFVQGAQSQFHDLVALDVTVDAGGHVRAMELRCARSFVASHGGVFAADVVRSFLGEAGAGADGGPNGRLTVAVTTVMSGQRADFDQAAPLRLHAAWGGDWFVVRAGDGATSSQGASQAPAAPGAKPLSEAAWQTLFLAAEDLPGAKLAQDSRAAGPDAGDADYARLGGQHGGFNVWMADLAAAAWRVVDIHLVFPSDAAAAEYLAAQLPQLSEGAPAVSGAPVVGADCHVFGGTRHNAILDADMTDFTYVFRTGRVVSKTYIAEGPNAKSGTLTAATAAALAAKVDKRVAAKLPKP